MKYIFFILVVALMGCTYDSGKGNLPELNKDEQVSNIDTSYCECEIFTPERKQRLVSEKDSIVKLLFSENDSVAVFGFHTNGPKTGEERLLFVGNKTVGYRTKLVLDSSINLVPEGREYTRILWLDLIQNLDSLPAISKARIEHEFSHPLGFTLSLFTRQKRKDHCICFSQYVVMQNKELKKMLTLIKEMALKQ